MFRVQLIPTVSISESIQNNKKRKRQNEQEEGQEDTVVGIIWMKGISTSFKEQSLCTDVQHEILKWNDDLDQLKIVLVTNDQQTLDGAEGMESFTSKLDPSVTELLLGRRQEEKEDEFTSIHLVLTMGQSFLETLPLIQKELITLGMFSSQFVFDPCQCVEASRSQRWTSEKLLVTSLQPEIVKTQLSAFIQVEYLNSSNVQPLHDKAFNKNRVLVFTSLSKNGEILGQDRREEIIMERVKAKNRKCELSISSHPNQVDDFYETSWESKSLSFSQRMMNLILPLNNKLNTFGLQDVNSTCDDKSRLILESGQVGSINSSLQSIYIAFNIETTCKTRIKLTKAMFQSLSLALFEHCKSALPHLFLNKKEKKQALMTQYYIPMVAEAISGIVYQSQNQAFKSDCLKLLQIDSVDEISGMVQKILIGKTKQ
ncbi:hypothetical protein C9374_002835 [Naegleria lovaniensis]|uniref:Uncharacterized protein n=1 Tax=Naegleria lovaniensis TaxID=51637 RepID=A0AA88GVB8_NAELO|nr:uncharacterized protein C9374_002835 [Naegleria lovaniensis]KAG2386389.1 hypothetical protein C9374_002835 [Naegleria lovaniensis]